MIHEFYLLIKIFRFKIYFFQGFNFKIEIVKRLRLYTLFKV